MARAPLEGMRIEEIGSRSEIFAQSHVMVSSDVRCDFFPLCLFWEISVSNTQSHIHNHIHTCTR